MNVENCKIGPDAKYCNGERLVFQALAINPKQCIGSIAHLHFQKFNLWTDIGIK